MSKFWWLATAVLTACSANTNTTRVPHVLVVGWDGTRSDAAQKAATPRLHALAAAGVGAFNATTQLTSATVSSPGWASVLTGVEATKHNVLFNGLFSQHDKSHPSYMERAHRDLGLKTAAACVWPDLCSEFLTNEGALDAVFVGDEEAVTAQVERWLREDDFRVIHVHLDAPDHAGHTTGFSPDNADYITAIEFVDRLTGRMVDAANARPSRSHEDWLFAVTTDHGGAGMDHGALDAENRGIFVVVGGDVRAGDLTAPSQMDVHPSVMTFLGLPPTADWDLDGHTIALPR